LILITNLGKDANKTEVEIMNDRGTGGGFQQVKKGGYIKDNYKNEPTLLKNMNLIKDEKTQ
jgi:hypothetical protein